MKNFLVKKSGLPLALNVNQGLSQNVDENQKQKNDVKTLMLIHGWGMNSQVWQPIREALESRYHLIWVDLPGHGFNRNIDAESLENMVELIAAQTPENTHIMAWSLGGLVAQALANKLPKQVKSLSLVATTPRFSQNREENTDTPQNKKEWKYAMTEIVLNRFADNLTKDPVKTLKGFIALQFMGVENSKQAQNDLINHILYSKSFNNGMDVLNEAKQRDEDLSTKWGGVSPDYPIGQETEISNIPSKEALDVGLSILKQADLRHLPMSCPEHWIFGEFDRLIPKQVINDLKSLRPDAQITMLEKAGHAPFITHRESFLSTTLKFLEAQD